MRGVGVACAFVALALVAGPATADPQADFNRAVEHCRNDSGAYPAQDVVDHCSWLMAAPSLTAEARGRVALMRAKSLLNLGRIVDARADIEAGMALAKTPRDQAVGYLLRGYSREMAGQNAEAQADFVRARQLDPGAVPQRPPPPPPPKPATPTPNPAPKPAPKPAPSNLGAHDPPERRGLEASCEFRALPLTLYTKAGYAPDFEYFKAAPAGPQAAGVELAVNGDFVGKHANFREAEFVLKDSRLATRKVASARILFDGRDILFAPVPQQRPTSTPGGYEPRVLLGMGDKGPLLLGPLLARARTAQVRLYDAAGGLLATSQTLDVSDFRLLDPAVAAANYSCGECGGGRRGRALRQVDRGRTPSSPGLIDNAGPGGTASRGAHSPGRA